MFKVGTKQLKCLEANIGLSKLQYRRDSDSDIENLNKSPEFDINDLSTDDEYW